MKSEFASVFLREFVKTLIINSKHHQIFQPSVTTQISQPLQQSQPSYQLINPITKIQPRVIQLPLPQIPKPAPQFQPIPLNQPLSQPIQETEFELGKINHILKDPAVLSVECTGPGKPILVNHSGITQTTSIILSSEEIKNIVQNFADRARIPLAGKVFKAAVNNIIITAILSDFIGTRFLIEKRIPQFAPEPQ